MASQATVPEAAERADAPEGAAGGADAGAGGSDGDRSEDSDAPPDSPDERPVCVAVVGGRTFGDRARAFRVLDGIASRLPVVRVVSGGAAGADTFAHEWAEARGKEFQCHLPVWQNGTHAGHERNTQIVEDVRDYVSVGHRGLVVAFWNGASAGTRDTLEKARAARLPCQIERY